MCCQNYAREISERHNEIQMETKSFLTYAFEVRGTGGELGTQDSSSSSGTMDDGEAIAMEEGLQNTRAHVERALVNVHAEKVMA